MTREQQISAAVKLLDVRGREDVAHAIEHVEFINVQHESFKKTKQYKQTLRQMKSALHRARVTHNKLPWDVRDFKFHCRQTHEKVHSRSPYLVEYTVVRDFGRLLERYEKLCEQLIAEAPTTKPKRDEFKKRAAAGRARDFLRWHGYSVTTTRTGRWCRLAAIFYGDPRASLYHICCELKKEEEGRNRVKNIAGSGLRPRTKKPA